MATARPLVRDAAIRAFATRGRRSAIIGLGACVPDRVLTNADLEQTVDTSDQWITERTGIRRRHIAEPGTASFELGVVAARRSLSAAGLTGADIDLVIVASSSPDAPFPPMACRIQEHIGAERATAFDLLAACTGWLDGVSIADAQIAAGRIENALVIGAETLSRILDWTDRSTCVLLGDAAAAAVVAPSPRNGAGFRSWCLGSDGRQWDLLTFGSFADTGAYSARDPDPRFRMRGQETFKVAVDVFVRQCRAVLDAAGASVEDVDLFVPHQANRRIIEAAAKRLGLGPRQVLINIDEYGNTSTATIPLGLEEALDNGRLRSGARVLVASFGAGLTWAAALMDWP
ncbi:MAG TPA: beta-ketoacyl-ACP synthase III [Candidatus Dormibacteraeota bacterium]|nr:beta-ketoacyl-ACP synthase III [Candidatus Dormibacteraeota bacterium]